MASIYLDSSPNEIYDPDSRDASEVDVEVLKDNQLRKLGYYTKEFLWLGSSWMCRKKRKHYPSFRRNGVKISVHDFVYVLAEEDKRLVAYLEDMYEDSRTNKMVVVRWFHKIDEVGIVLPHNFNDREIFFSLCLQDLSIECIDGLAAVLSPQHYEKFLNEATHTQLEPFVCHQQFDNDDARPFDITQVKGYWKQEILRYMFSGLHSKNRLNSQHFDDAVKGEENGNDAIGLRPRKRHRRLIDDDMDLLCTDNRDSVNAACTDLRNLGNSFTECKRMPEMCSLKVGKEAHPNPSLHLKIGSLVEVLSQDCGIRGCWFRALILKKHKDKVKVQYQDIQDADDESKKLEEWISASKIAVPDHLGLRIGGRKIIRPSPLANQGKVSWVVDVGTAVDVWWNDGWWEGIVVKKESEDKFHVYFPGEKKELLVSRGDLRHSQEWLENGWTHVKERPDLVLFVLSHSEIEQVRGKSPYTKVGQVAICDSRPLINNGARCSDTLLDSGDNQVKESGNVLDLSKDNLLAQLKWKTSRKRRRGNGSSSHKGNYSDDSKGSSPESSTCNRFLIPASLKVDHENCKYMGDSIFSSSVVPPLSSLVMSR